MTCMNSGCKYEFCWICLGEWGKGEDNDNCSRFQGANVVGSDAQKRSRDSLDRYHFHYDRYMNHMNSLRFEHKLYADVKEKMEQIMQKYDMTSNEVEFLKKAVDILCQCRQTLMYTYAFAYYLKKNNQSEIFGDNQKDLQEATETLSGYLERDLKKETKGNLDDIKQKVQDKYKYCDGRRRVLVQHVYEGYDKDWWKYSSY